MDPCNQIIIANMKLEAQAQSSATDYGEGKGVKGQ
jgi:hypothetical protein